MVAQAVKSYKELFDEKIENSTFVVLVIGWLIVLVWIFIPDVHGANYMKSSIVEYSQSVENENTIIINGEEYIVYITKK